MTFIKKNKRAKTDRNISKGTPGAKKRSYNSDIVFQLYLFNSWTWFGSIRSFDLFSSNIS